MKAQNALCLYCLTRADILERVPKFWKQIALELLQKR